ncbi:MAG: hypothetical protein COV73_04175 [Candidatus Omnitrophica bacterium CG11_big_fil_rev_8_21_14_0_20_43_6]|nr:MAG: hypothetical protein COV73_04175 [Candidatus Omnitrophica bacterium CG11_big_fil_rev_8_21_14_0_20_43_6]
MIKRVVRYIPFIFILTAAVYSKLTAAEEDVTGAVVIERPVMEYKSGKFRDPFKTYLVTEQPKPAAQETAVEIETPQFDFNKVKVQGIIWGVSIPQAIINDQVVTVGDLVEGAKILAIDKKGITLSYYGQTFDLSAPRQVSVPRQQ